jgi:hypothetical protein
MISNCGCYLPYILEFQKHFCKASVILVEMADALQKSNSEASANISPPHLNPTIIEDIGCF